MSYFYSAEHSFVKDINGELVQIVYNYFHGEKECCFCEFSIISLSKSKEKITIPEFYIPTEIDGFKVLDIGDGVNAIHSCKNLTDERIIINKLIIPSCMKIHALALSNNTNNTNNTKSSGIGFTGLLQLLFIALKLCGVIKWSWLWVLAPSWISVALIIVVIIVLIIIETVRS